MTGHATVVRGDARRLPIADNTVDIVVTSPPYFALRSYQDGGEHYAGQLGSEATPAEFVDALLEVTRECMRVLKPSGSLWVNLGDKYAGGGAQWEKDERPDPHKRRAASGKISSGGKTFGLRPKSLMGIPWRYAIRCIDELGLILRAEVIWSKPNGLPESVTDRVRRSHEQWFHFTLSPRYYSAVDEIREETNPANDAHSARYREAARTYGRAATDAHPRSDGNGNGLFTPNPLGKLPGSVWTIPTEPLIVPDHLGVDHFAAYPTEWPRRIIQGWSPAGVCVECGEGRRPVAQTADLVARGFGAQQESERGWNGGDPLKRGLGVPASERERTITGYACACPDTSAPTTPGVVLDPFGGTGTTALVAKALGRHGITVDMSADYCRLATWRTNDPAQLAKAARKPFTPSNKPLDGQVDLLDLLDGGAA
jgi:DNA modification methylase